MSNSPRLSLLLLAGCGGGDDIAAVPDASGAADATPSCGVTWELHDRPAESLSVLGSGPAVAGRTVRVAVEVAVEIPCEQHAMITVGYTLENEGVVITPRVWRESGCRSDEFTFVTRPVVLDDLYAGTWTITAPGAENLTIDVDDTAVACDTNRATCALDCDCNVARGERCLAYDSFAGPTTACAKPCELDRDCGGTACDGEIADGLGYACSARPECGPGSTGTCFYGWTCDAGACTPDFALDNATRRECACDADCDQGMRCANPFDPNEPRRCEALCYTAGPWCEGAHMCGSIGLDAAGLAGVDSVCVWLGE